MLEHYILHIATFICWVIGISFKDVGWIGIYIYRECPTTFYIIIRVKPLTLYSYYYYQQYHQWTPMQAGVIMQHSWSYISLNLSSHDLLIRDIYNPARLKLQSHYQVFQIRFPQRMYSREYIDLLLIPNSSMMDDPF